MHTYEITVELDNQDWLGTRVVTLSFHEAAVFGLDFAGANRGKLIRIERMPAGTPGRAFGARLDAKERA